MGGGTPGGGFFTGWKGISVGVAAVAAVVGLAGTGIVGSENNTVILGIASSQFVAEETDFGEILYGRCRMDNVTYNDGTWQETFTFPDGTSDDRIKLSNLDALVELGGVFPGNDSNPASYRNRPEAACFAVCRQQFNESCTFFTYDGLTEDSCRFVSPGQSPPPSRDVDTETEGENFFIFNGTCMQEVREGFFAIINQPKVNLTRPDNDNTAGGAAGPDAWAGVDYIDAMVKSLTFLQTQWAGALTVNFNATAPGNEWRRPGFVEKAAGCPENLGGSFATGGSGVFLQFLTSTTGVSKSSPEAYAPARARITAYSPIWVLGAFTFSPEHKDCFWAFLKDDHIQATIATAQQAGVMALSRLWWTETFDNDAETKALTDFEIGWQSQYLTSVFDADAGEVLVGVGDQRDEDGNLVMYNDFGRADFALQVGPNPDNEFGQFVPVPPECTYSTPESPAADVAAQSAAALALSSLVVRTFLSASGNQTGLPTTTEMLETASGLYEYSKEKAPLTGIPSSVATDVAQNLGLWAACTLFQATDDVEYWNDAETIYTTFIRPELEDNNQPPAEFRPYQLFDPVANYYNPIWWAMLCMAQSAPQYTGLEEEANLAVPRQVAGGQDEDEFKDFLLNQEFKRATRGEATQQIWRQFVLPWITYDGAVPNDDDKRITASAGDSFRYFDINGPEPDSEIVVGGPPGVSGVFRDSAGAAVVGLLYADLPGVDADQSHWARCMAVQNVNFMLGVPALNADEFSYLVGFGSDSPVNPYHKDAACPGETVRAQQFEFVFNNSTRIVDNPNNTLSDELSTRLCDFLTFQGDPTLAENTRPPDDDGNTFYSEGDSINPVLDNTFNLTGALVSSFLPAAEVKYTDERMICPDGSSFRNQERTVPGSSDDAIASERCSGEDPVANPLSQVSVDANGALSAALAGIANLPPSFWDRGCPSPQELAEVTLDVFNTVRIVNPVEDINPNVPSSSESASSADASAESASGSDDDGDSSASTTASDAAEDPDEDSDAPSAA